MPTACPMSSRALSGAGYRSLPAARHEPNNGNCAAGLEERVKCQEVLIFAISYAGWTDIFRC